MVIAPIVEDFIFTQALRINEQEFLGGAKQAVVAVNQALRKAMQGDGRYMEALERSHSLTPALHDALMDEISELRDGDSTDTKLCKLDFEQRSLDAGLVELTHTQLVVGAMRDFFPRRPEERSFLAIGSHLQVCGRAEDNLWSVDTQGQLIEDEGCSIRLTVDVGGAERSDAAGNNEYIFEAAVDNDMILERPGHNELHFQLADIRGRTNGDAFWSTAHEVGMDRYR